MYYLVSPPTVPELQPEKTSLFSQANLQVAIWEREKSEPYYL